MNARLISELGGTDDWQAFASCAGRYAVFFSPDDGEERAQRRRREAIAKSICAGCPVRVHCLNYALRRQEPFGVWGGLTVRERRARLRAGAGG